MATDRLRLLLACIASLVLGLNRDENGRPAGMRTTMLVTLAATLAALQMNLLLDTNGKTPSSFSVLDLMRLPLGILSGIGFIGAGTIIKKGDTATGVTTAATLWFSTVLGLLFGGGQILLGISGTALAVIILLGLKRVEHLVPREHRGVLTLYFADTAPAEAELRAQVESAGCTVEKWSAEYRSGDLLDSIRCEVSWRAQDRHGMRRPARLDHLRRAPGIVSFRWDR